MSGFAVASKSEWRNDVRTPDDRAPSSVGGQVGQVDSAVAIRARTMEVSPHADQGVRLSDSREAQSTRGSTNTTLTVPISSLLPADSPRLTGENADHARLLADLAGELPPIIVHRSTNRVIDGMHRLRAALLRGEREIEVTYFDGDDADAFVLAVEANVARGLPLSHTDRSAAAVRIMRSHPYWSDRKVASVTGLVHRTVGRLRTANLIPRQESRIGIDGRVRPLDSASVRLRIWETLRKRPDASLREIANDIGVSPTTVAKVRKCLREGADPIPQKSNRQRATTGQDPVVPQAAPVTRLDVQAALHVLKTDPSLRFTAAGRFLLHQLNGHMAGKTVLGQLTGLVPAHCAPAVAALANEVASTWQEFAEALERRP